MSSVITPKSVQKKDEEDYKLWPVNKSESVPSGTSLQTYFGAQPPHCLPFLLYMILKS